MRMRKMSWIKGSGGSGLLKELYTAVCRSRASVL